MVQQANLTMQEQFVNRTTSFLKLYAALSLCPGVALFVFAVVIPAQFEGLALLGLLFTLCGTVLLAIALGFGAYKAWSYPIVYVLVATFWGLRGTNPLANREIMRSTELRQAFGLKPVASDNK